MKRIEVFGLASPGAWLNIQVPPELRAAFSAMVHRATNLWPDATPEIKEFADLVTNGKVWQDYTRQDTSGSSSPTSPVDPQ